jgi:phage-related protein
VADRDAGCRSLGKGLWEVRSRFPGNRISRVIFCFHGNAPVLLHAFIKKSQKTRQDDLELARARMKEVMA